MKYLICSDLHGSECCTKRLTDIFTAESFDYMILLGDILYHGPRNPLPQGHNPQAVVALLNPLKDKIIACRGNCDAEVDQMLLEFPMLADYSLVVDDGVRLFCTHGHIYNPENPPCIGGIDVLLFGHIHVQQLYKKKTILLYAIPVLPLCQKQIPMQGMPFIRTGILRCIILQVKNSKNWHSEKRR